METVACLLIDHPASLVGLGHQPVLMWVVEQLLGVRGVDRIAALVADHLFRQARRVLPETIEVEPLPKGLDDSMPAMLQWFSYSYLTNTHKALILRPLLPFLPAARMEAMLEALQATTAPMTELALQYADVIAQVARDRVVGIIPQVAGPIRSISVNLIQALDISDEQGMVIAQALTNSGVI